MKGVSAIIAIILILMIVVSLAALVYTWFQGIFGSLTTGATNATTTATTALGMQISIEAAKFYDTPYNHVNATIRNKGTINIDPSKFGVYIDGSLSPDYTYPLNKISPADSMTIMINNTTSTCPNKVLKITIESGFEDYRTITC